MIATKETIYTKDPSNKKLKVVREFDAPLQKVWNAWTKSELLDQWWAPRPWKAVTQSQDFKEGGTWYYYMQGPESECHYCRVDYKKIVPNKSFSGYDAFCDDKGNINKEFPQMLWECQFTSTSSGTKVEVEIIFDSEADLQKIVEMGFKEGFAMAHNNLDELLTNS
jgi:uncharacterized protein YndB with AHSA1/START domain